MTRHELRFRIGCILPHVDEVAQKLRELRDAPDWDEDYKVQRDSRINAEVLDHVAAKASALLAAAGFLP